MKPTVTQIARAFKVEPEHLLDTNIRGTIPRLNFARAAFATLARRERPLNHIAKDLNMSTATTHKWAFNHETFMRNPIYAATFAKLAEEAA